MENYSFSVLSSLAVTILTLAHGIAFSHLLLYEITWNNFLLCLVFYWIRIFSLHGGCHRLFAHRSFKTFRIVQFLIGLIAASCLGNSPLFWATHHRMHHQFSDTDKDLHSPKVKGFWWAHMGWSLYLNGDWIDSKYAQMVPDLLHYKELIWIDNYWYFCTIGELSLYYVIGGYELMSLGVLSMVLAIHGESLTNSMGHTFGSRPFDCQFNAGCDARNNWFLAFVNGGEGWHNNHHACMRSARHGFEWWQIDTVFYTIQALSWIGLVWDVQLPDNGQLHKVHE